MVFLCISQCLFFMDVKNKLSFVAHICLMNGMQRNRVAPSFLLMGPSRPTIQAVQRKWGH